MLLAFAVIAEAQQSTKVPRIGFLVASTADAQLNRTDSFRRGLRELGYVEGQNIVIEYKFAEASDRLRAGSQLVRLKFDVIVVQTLRSACCSNATNNPDRRGRWCRSVTNGLVASAAGRERDQLTNAATDLGETIELLKRSFPARSRKLYLESAPAQC
jgi:putative ABC transport system substrate-binding protein